MWGGWVCPSKRALPAINHTTSETRNAADLEFGVNDSPHVRLIQGFANPPGPPDCQTVSIDVSAFRYASGGDWPKPARGAPVSPGAVDEVAVVAAHPFDQPRRPTISATFPKRRREYHAGEPHGLRCLSTRRGRIAAA